MTNISDRLTSLNSCLVLLPETIPVSLAVREIRNPLAAKGFWCESLPRNDGNTPPRSPLTTLSNAVGAKWQGRTVPRTIRTAPDHLLFPDRMPDVLFIDALHSPERDLGWKGMHFLPEWAGLVKNMKDRGKRLPSLCQVIHAQPEYAPPEEVIFYKVFYWWGFPSAPERQMICQAAENGEDISAAGRWKKMILPWLCGSDIGALDHLLNERRLDEDRIGKALDRLAAKREWNRDTVGMQDIEQLSGQYLPVGAEDPVRPSSAVWPAWAKGMLNFCPDCGLAVSPVALKVFGMDQELRHRCWRAQCSLLLPLLDQCRLRICQYLSRKHGANWPLDYLSPVDRNEAEALKTSSFNCQYGHLGTLLYAWPALWAEKEKVGKFVYQFRMIRNELAHNRPITYWDFKQCLADIDRFQKTMGKE